MKKVRNWHAGRGVLKNPFVGPSPTLNASAKSRGEERIVSSAVNGGAALVVQGDSNLKTGADFRGKTIGTPRLGNTQDVSCRAWLTSQGLKITQTGGDARVLPTANADQGRITEQCESPLPGRAISTARSWQRMRVRLPVRERARTEILATLFFAMLIVIWDALVRLHIWSPVLLPSPSLVLECLVQATKDGTLREAILVTMRRWLIGYVIGVAIGLPLGFLNAASRFFEDTIGVLALGLQTLPSVCWIPLALLWFGQSEGAMLFVNTSEVFAARDFFTMNKRNSECRPRSPRRPGRVNFVRNE